MKSLLLLSILLLIACQDKAEVQSTKISEISVSSINGEMGCENCKMNLKKFISTSHAIKTKNDGSRFYCSINCSTIASEEIKENIKEVYAIDYGLTKYFPVGKMYYVIGSNLKGTMTKISKFAFSDKNKAEFFMDTFEGKEIVDFSEAYNMSLQEIKNRTKK